MNRSVTDESKGGGEEECEGNSKRPAFDLEVHLPAWIQEQLDVASRVVVLPNPVPPPIQQQQQQQQQHQQQQCARFRALSLNNIHLPTSRIDITHTPNHLYGGVDVSFPNNDDDDEQNPAVAVYVIIDANRQPDCQIVYQDYEYLDPLSVNVVVPYIPSFLAFREIAPLQRLVEKQQRQRPDLIVSAILVDGNGILHPRRAGLACFLGVRTGIPTIGVGKSLFCCDGLSKEGVQRTIDESLLAAVAVAGAVDVAVAVAVAVDHVQQSMDPKVKPTDEEDCGCRRRRRVILVDNNGRRKESTVLVTKSASDTDTKSDEITKMNSETINRGTLLRQLGPVCQGVAIPLVVNDHQQRGGGGQTILACALVGHGGRIRVGRKGGASKLKLSGGSKNPIFVSVGHQISLHAAVQICASLSLARIPEPVRQADLIGRSLLRQRLFVVEGDDDDDHK